MRRSENSQRRRLLKEKKEERDSFDGAAECRTENMDRLKRKADARKPPKGRLKKLRIKGSGEGENSADDLDRKGQVEGESRIKVYDENFTRIFDHGRKRFEDKWRRGDAQLFDSRLWVDKHSPTSEKDLAVHSRKVAEVKQWIEEQLRDPSKAQSRMLVLTGPAGVGKTAVVRSLANSMDLEVLEWRTPTPILWHEYSHHAVTGAPYMSKIDDFEAFIRKARKFLPLPTAGVHAARQGPTLPGFKDGNPSKERAKLLIIDDLPNAHDKAHRQRLCESLHVLAIGSKFPTVLIITDEVGTGEQREERKILTNEIIQELERAGAKKIAFNPITVNGVLKVLKRVQLIEKCKAPFPCLSAIAESCSGDIRQALTSLQFLCLGYESKPSHSSVWDPGGCRVDKRSSNKSFQKLDTESDVSKTPALGDRDLTLSLFHALGKFLHNKRQSDAQVQASSFDGLKLKDEYCRNPLKMAEPETILSQAHAETSTVAAFLHENFLQFVDDEATDDVSAISGYLSDTDCLLCGEGSMRFRRAVLNFNDIEPYQVANAASSSVAARGLLFANAHPAPPRWQTLRAPSLWQVERQHWQKKVETHSQAFSHTTFVSSSVLHTEMYPYRHRLPIQSPGAAVPMEDHEISNVETPFVEEDEMEVDAISKETSSVKEHSYVVEPRSSEIDIEDEIEEW
ncbi:hypothetical protein R1flu_006241 [Riccia fluitans]|uniref:AAA+ ATPase domain-containing protein n=1 Tax=Riccia fluitans TaxID=41844 RepID=A0ABD1YZI3_9MARC